jgi:hypothetical protein
MVTSLKSMGTYAEPEMDSENSRVAKEFKAAFGDSGRNSFVFTNGQFPFYTLCMGMLPDGCIEVNIDFAEICILADRKGYGNGVFHILRHEKSHRERGTPISLQEVLTGNDFSSVHVIDELKKGKKLELVNCSEKVILSELYALKESASPIDDFSSAMAIFAFMFYSKNESEKNPLKRMIWELHGREAKLGCLADHFICEQAVRSYDEYICHNEIRKINHYNYFSDAALTDIQRNVKRKYADLIRA